MANHSGTESAIGQLSHSAAPLLNELFDSSPVASFAIDSNHLITHINRAYARTFGVSASDLIGTRSLNRKVYGDDRPMLVDLIVDPSLIAAYECEFPGRLQRSTTDSLEIEIEFKFDGADVRWLYCIATPLHDADGGLIGAIGTAQDVSDRKNVELELVKTQKALHEQLSMAQDQLVQSEKLSSIGQLAAGVAHEINNPIGYIFSNFGTLEKYLEDMFKVLGAYEAFEEASADIPAAARMKLLRDEVELEFLKEDIPVLMRESREGIVRVRKIVQDLKDFSHVDATHEWQFVDLTQCIDSTLNVVNNELKYKADIVRNYADLPEVQCRGSEINQVIMNLVVNAAHAIGAERGTITINTGSDTGHAWFEVIDTGSGIAKESLARIFDPFFTTKPVGKGTGLGLSISYGIVQKHHGTIAVETEIGRGSSFRVSLPLLQPEETAVEAALSP